MYERRETATWHITRVHSLQSPVTVGPHGSTKIVFQHFKSGTTHQHRLLPVDLMRTSPGFVGVPEGESACEIVVVTTGRI